jgi:hypothetical protein
VPDRDAPARAYGCVSLAITRSFLMALARRPSEHVVRLEAGFRSANGRPAVPSSDPTSVQFVGRHNRGQAPPPAVLVMGYYVGSLANTLACGAALAASMEG